MAGSVSLTLARTLATWLFAALRTGVLRRRRVSLWFAACSEQRFPVLQQSQSSKGQAKQPKTKGSRMVRFELPTKKFASV